MDMGRGFAIWAEPFKSDIPVGDLKLVQPNCENLIEVDREVKDRSAGCAVEMAVVGKGDIVALPGFVDIHLVNQSGLHQGMQRVVNGAPGKGWDIGGQGEEDLVGGWVPLFLLQILQHLDALIGWADIFAFELFGEGTHGSGHIDNTDYKIVMIINKGYAFLRSLSRMSGPCGVAFFRDTAPETHNPLLIHGQVGSGAGGCG